MSKFHITVEMGLFLSDNFLMIYELGKSRDLSIRYKKSRKIQNNRIRRFIIHIKLFIIHIKTGRNKWCVYKMHNETLTKFAYENTIICSNYILVGQSN